MVTTEHPELVNAVALVSSQATEVPVGIAQAPFVVCDPTRPVNERLAVPQEVFFAPGNDVRVWLDRWYPETRAMQRGAIGTVPLQEHWTCGLVPLLEVTPEHDALRPRRYWQEMQDDFGGRVTTVMVAGAGHALFPSSRKLRPKGSFFGCGDFR